MARSIAWYGESGTYKSTQMLFFIKYVYEKTGKKTRVVLTDSSAGDMFKPAEAAGMADVWRISALNDPLPVCRMLAKGYWPAASPEGKVIMSPPNAQTWEVIGGLGIDSMTTFCDLVMSDLISKNRKVAEEIVSSYEESVAVEGGKTESVKFGASARAHYNFIQNQAYTLINSASSLPIEALGLTFLESKGEEQDRSTIYGPALVGKAATPKVPAWVGDLIHLESYLIPKTRQMDDPTKPGSKIEEKYFETKVRGYYMRHADPKTGINFPAKPRVPSNLFPKLMEKFPNGYFEPSQTEGLDTFLKFEDSLGAEQTDALKKWREEMDAKRRGQAATTPAK